MAKTASVLDYALLTEHELVTHARVGDREAFRLIMQRCNQRLFRVARSVLGNDPEAEDVLQETYTKAFAGFDAFRGDASLLTWLTAIILNEARGRLRKRRPTVDLTEVEGVQTQSAEVVMFPGGRSDPEETLARSQIRHMLEHAIDDLPESFRLVFIMRDVEGCSIEETARYLDLLPQTVKTRLFRARRLLRDALDERLSDTLKGSFPFLGARCSRITEAVLNRLAPQFMWAALDPG